ncbi:hypothetical protein CEUSTIGMA_g2108.t1 [Chlamydomonas eustigma]|uniref:adenylate kinase n=1 Tax=Chlamydomonas eustigma TaxID=1157962 RepID=A0A250WVV2_9CHLO|nr:hypothetical protein CEUSTIGMA_g2108.t1 [Chlamydomonas eustigma]|eukprot:GAX74660.1 hypothetical protein CEUSTIGMA_g2108.t1 [Chlamydomonas eustigma]
MAPKAGSKAVQPKVVQVSALDLTFPLWTDVPDEPKETKSKDKDSQAEKFEDPFGTLLPPAAEAYLDTWKRPEELVLHHPEVPMLRFKPPNCQSDTKASKGATVLSRDHEGRLFPGHKSFEWLKSVFDAIISVQKKLPPSTYLWELIYPKEKDGTASKTLNGKYRVKLFIMGEWRAVTVDDRLPVDLFGQFLVVGVRPLQLWPMILSKAIVKVMAAQRILDLNLPHQVAAFRMLTGWPQEDLIDPLCGAQLQGGFLFDRLEDLLVANDQRPLERTNVGMACLITRALPEKTPPRIVVLVGPSGVGRSKILSRLAEQHPDKFGLVVSHTTRQPYEHEVDGKDYFFVTKSKFRAEIEASKMLEHACVSGIHNTYMYGTSIATVREVAATGRICLMGLDEQGVKTLRADHRIDGLYLFVSPPSLGDLEQRLRGRLKEAESTIQKRLAWAEAEIGAAAKPRLYQHIIQNIEGTGFRSDSDTGVYYQLKEAISTLSPIIRNRLRGLPAYVLDYSDLIAPNLVEKPFLKPVIISGPSTGERTALLEQLVREFPDVFAFPQLTTTRHMDELEQHLVSKEELTIIKAPPVVRTRTATPVQAPRGGAAAATGISLDGPGGLAAGIEGSGEGSDTQPHADQSEGSKPSSLLEAATQPSLIKRDKSLYPDPIVLTSEEFEEATRNGSLLEHHQDLFLHPSITRRTGVTKAAIRDVLLSGKLPLLELESDSLAQLAQLKSGDLDVKISNDMYLAVFLQPPSLEEYRDRLVRWLTETDEDIRLRMELSRGQISGSRDPKLYDHIIVNDDLHRSYGELEGLMQRYRPDVMNRDEDGRGETPAAADPAAGGDADRDPVLVLCCPPGSTASSQLSTALCATYPDKFIVPLLLTDRKAAKGEVSTPTLQFVTAKELTKLNAEGSIAVTYPGEGGSSLAITKEALQVIRAKNAVAVITLPAIAAQGLPASLRDGPLPRALYIFVQPPGVSREATDQAGAAATASGLYDQVIYSEKSVTDQVSFARDALTLHVPSVIPPPLKPIIIAGPFGTGKRVLLQQLFDQLPGKFAVPVITTTRPAGPTDIGDRSDMEVVSKEEANALLASGAFLVHEAALDHVYGITVGAVKKVQATGRICVLELDHVTDAKRLRDQGFEGTYFFIGVDSMDELFKRVQAEIKSNPPLGYDLEEAAHLFFQSTKKEIVAARANKKVFDTLIDNGPDAAAAFSHLAEAVHRVYPEVVVKHFVWGYGRSLWDASVRKYGEHPLRVMVLGPAGSGKSTQCEMLSKQFQIPHINVGDLLYDEVKAATPRGLAAKRFMDDSKIVPDEYFIQLLGERLQKPDCRANGWLLDGFPHTAPQTEALLELGIIPDKVIFLTATNEVLLDRTRHRKIDYITNKVYHIPAKDAHALCATIEPVGKDGKPDAEIMTRLHPRHDDSEENVKARLALWDVHCRHLRAAYEDVSLRLQADTRTVKEPFELAADFLTLEARVPEVPVMISTKLKQLQYEIVDAMRYRRQQLVRLHHPDERALPWVNVKELVSNCHGLLLGRDPMQFEPHQLRRRANLSKAPRTLLMLVESPEPSEVLISLDLGMQWALDDRPAMVKRILMVCGPTGSGKSTAIDMLVKDHASKVAVVPALSTRPVYKGETPGRPYNCLLASELATEVAAGEAFGHSSISEDGMYAASLTDLMKVWAKDKLAVMEAPLTLAEAVKAEIRQAQADVAAAGPAGNVGKLKSLIASIEVKCVYLTADVETLDVRLRRAEYLEEARLQQQLRFGMEEQRKVEEEQQQYISSGGLSSSGGRLVDFVHNAEGSVHEVFMGLRDIAGSLWHRPRAAVPCQVVVEQFDWKWPKPGPTQLRMRTMLSTGSTLELPRGRHLMRVNANLEQLHSVTFMSTTKRVFANEYVEVMHEAESPPCISTCLEGEYPTMSAGSCCALMRYNIKVSEPTLMAATLAISGEDLRSCSRLALVNNKTGEEMVVPLGRMPATELLPSSEGYALVALGDVPRAPALLPVRPGSVAAQVRSGNDVTASAATTGIVEDGSWALTVTASRQPSVMDPAPVQRVQTIEGAYEPNSKWIMARQLLVPTVETHLALVVSTEPAVPFKLLLMKVPAGTEVSWTGSYPVVMERSAMAGELVLHNATLAPGKYVACYVLEGGEECVQGLQPNPVDGSLVGGGGPIKWRAVYMPTADEKVCPIVADDSLQRYFRSMMDAWSTAAGVPTGKAPKGAAAAPGGLRAQQAAAALERCAAEAAAVSGQGQVPAVRTLKDGSSLQLLPDARLTVKSVPEAQAAVLSAEQLAERAAAAARLISVTASVPVDAGGLLAALEKGKSSRGALAARRASEFSEWRSVRTMNAGGALKARAEAMQRIKQKEAEALEAEAAALEPPPQPQAVV